MRNQQLFEAPFVSEVSPNYCSKCMRAGAGECLCNRHQREVSPLLYVRPDSKSIHQAQWLFEAPPQSDREILERQTPDWFSPPSSLPRVIGVKFVNTGTTHPDNCCALCPENLGVGINGTAQNAMELQFTISGHRSGVWYDILRTRRNSLWEQRAGVWSRLERQPMGTFDDNRSIDECLRIKRNRIFVIDTPGYRTPLPAKDDYPFRGFTPGVAIHADAREVVLRFSFAEWVIAKHRDDGIPWTQISKLTFWHSITWLTRDASNRWVLNRARSEIARGSLSAAIIDSAPV